MKKHKQPRQKRREAPTSSNHPIAPPTNGHCPVGGNPALCGGGKAQTRSMQFSARHGARKREAQFVPTVRVQT